MRVWFFFQFYNNCSDVDVSNYIDDRTKKIKIFSKSDCRVSGEDFLYDFVFCFFFFLLVLSYKRNTYHYPLYRAIVSSRTSNDLSLAFRRDKMSFRKHFVGRRRGGAGRGYG